MLALESTPSLRRDSPRRTRTSPDQVIILSPADREVTVLEANAYRDAEQIRGSGDATATRIYAEAFNQDKEFYSFTRSLRAYQDSFLNSGDIILIRPDSEFFRYLKDPQGGK